MSAGFSSRRCAASSEARERVRPITVHDDIRAAQQLLERIEIRRILQVQPRTPLAVDDFGHRARLFPAVRIDAQHVRAPQETVSPRGRRECASGRAREYRATAGLSKAANHARRHRSRHGHAATARLRLRCPADARPTPAPSTSPLHNRRARRSPLRARRHPSDSPLVRPTAHRRRSRAPTTRPADDAARSCATGSSDRAPDSCRPPDPIAAASSSLADAATCRTIATPCAGRPEPPATSGRACSNSATDAPAAPIAAVAMSVTRNAETSSPAPLKRHDSRKA